MNSEGLHEVVTTIDMDIIRCNRTTLVGIDGSHERHQKSVSCSDKSPEDVKVRMRCSRKSEGARSTDCKSKSQSPRIHQRSQQKSSVNEKLNDTVGTSIDEDEASDDDDGVYDETFRYSSYKFIEDNDSSLPSQPNQSHLPEITKEKDSPVADYLEHAATLQLPARSRATSEEDSIECPGAKGHQRSVSLTNNKVISDKQFNVKSIRRYESVGTETYKSKLEKVYEVERLLVLEKESFESYGFHLLGFNPMVVSTIEADSAAKRAGLVVGDRLVTVNGFNVLKEDAQFVTKLVAENPVFIQLGVASGVLVRDDSIHCGYIQMRSEGILKSWKKRWCEVKHNGFLYYYKDEEDVDHVTPLGAICLQNYMVAKISDAKCSFSFKLIKYGQKTLYMQAETESDMNRWASAFNKAATCRSMPQSMWLDVSSHNVCLPALSIKNPECHGWLTKVGNRTKSWKKRYCILKNACLYYYKELKAETAKGVVHLHGYSVEEDSSYNRKFLFTLAPPVVEMRTFFFTADNETDMNRWIAALKLSIGRWVKVED